MHRYFFLLHLSLKKPKWFRFQNLRIKQIQPIADQYYFCLFFSKLLEKQVHIYLNDYLEKRQLLHPIQSGFRREYSCNTALARLSNSWLTAMNHSEVSGVVFLDLKKAFHQVDHDILLKKLAIYLKNCTGTSFLANSHDYIWGVWTGISRPKGGFRPGLSRYPIEVARHLS